MNNDKFSTAEHTVRVPKLGDVNMTESVRFKGQVLSGRIKEQAGKWYLIVTVKVEPVVQPAVSAHRSVGIDFGLSTFATLSNGEKSETQAPYRQAQGKLKKLQRALARKKKGSKNRARQKLKVARAHERVANVRNDFLHKFTRKVVNAFSIVCVETLSLKGLVQTRMAKSFHDAGIGKAIELLDYKSKEQGGIVQKVGRFFPSSKRCHVCGYINHDLQLSDREWICPPCDMKHDRDGNASVNLEIEGVSLLVGSGSLDVTTVEFAASGLKLASI